MTDAFRIKVVTALIQEIGVVTGGNFERFCYHFMAHLFPDSWVQRGTTVMGAPRGYTVDMATTAAEWVAEAGTEQGYFSGNLKKPKDDIAHAMTMHPQLKRLWLLSSREALAGETAEVANVEAQQSTKHHIELSILDARRIADSIFAAMDSERFVRSISEFLPSLQRYADEYEFGHRVPPCIGYRHRVDEEAVGRTILANNPCLIVSGMSGIGKSAYAAILANGLRSEFDNVIWLDGSKATTVQGLSAAEIGRYGLKHNITGLLATAKCLLVLDDSPLDSSVLNAIAGPQSRIIVTTQVTADSKALHMRELKREESKLLLESNVSIPCPTFVFETVLKAVGGYPLLLVALNRIALEQPEGWEAVEDCCKDAVVAVEDERHEKVCNRLLQRHTASLDNELAFFKWLGVPRCSPELLSVCVSSQAARNLSKRGFLAAAAAQEIRVHDLVFKSVEAVVQPTLAQVHRFSTRLADFVDEECQVDSTTLNRMARQHGALFRRLLAEGSRGAYRYAVALAREDAAAVQLLGDVVGHATALRNNGAPRVSVIDVRAIIESVVLAATRMRGNLT